MDEAFEAWKKGDISSCLHILDELASDSRISPEFKANRAAANFIAGSQACKEYHGPDIKDIMAEALTDAEPDGSPAADKLPHSYLLLLNTATVLFNAHQSMAAAKLLQPLWQSIEANTVSPGVGEDVILGTCALVIDIEFASKNYSRVAAVLGCLERRFDLASDDKEDGDSKVSGIDNASSIHSGEYSQQVSPGSPHLADQASRVVGGFNVSQFWLNWKARLYLVTGNIKAAKKEIKSLLALDLSNSQAISLKAELEALRGNLRRAGKLVTARTTDAASSWGSEEVQSLCNMAYIQHCEGKHHTAVLCYSRALKLACKTQPALTLLLGGEEINASAANSHNADAAILYSCGMQSLLMKQYDLALDCFQKCAPTMFRDPFLWIRMAECCVGALTVQKPLQNILDDIIELKQSNRNNDSANGIKAAEMTKTLQHGQQCAANAVFLFSSKLSSSSSSREGQQHQGAPNGLASYADEMSTLADGPLQRSVEAYQTQSSKAGRSNALCICAFLSLQLDQPASALQYALELLNDTDKGSQDWQLGRAYASEALHILGKPQEAAEHLQAALEAVIEASGQQQEKSTDHRAHDGNRAEEKPQSLSSELLHSFKVAVLINLASAYFSAGDMPQASEFAQESAADEENRDALLTNAYIQLCQGETNPALSQLKAFQLGVVTRM